MVSKCLKRLLILCAASLALLAALFLAGWLVELLAPVLDRMLWQIWETVIG